MCVCVGGMAVILKQTPNLLVVAERTGVNLIGVLMSWLNMLETIEIN